MRLTGAWLIALVAGCSLSVKAKPDLAQPDVWPVQPRTIALEPTRAIGAGQNRIEAVDDALAYSIGYLTRLGFRFVADEDADLVLLPHVFEADNAFNLGRAQVDTVAGSCDVEINAGKLDMGAEAATRMAVRTVVLHELGHCLGLVVTPTESAEVAPGDTLAHCRNTECAMTRYGVAPWWAHVLGWIHNAADGRPTFDRACEMYLRRRLAEPAQA